MKTRIRIQGLLVFLAIVFSVLLPKAAFPQWKKEALDEFLDAIGIGITFFGLLFRISARGYKAEVSPSGEHLITDGPYSQIRHPMYFGTLLISSGIILVLFKWWVFTLFLIIFLIIYIPQIRREENSLCIRFGERYKNYCSKIPKYFPNIFTFFKTDIRDYLYFEWGWAKRELPTLTGVIIAVISIETWEDVKLFGYHEFGKELLELSLIFLFFVSVFTFLYKRRVD